MNDNGPPAGQGSGNLRNTKIFLSGALAVVLLALVIILVYRPPHAQHWGTYQVDLIELAAVCIAALVAATLLGRRSP